MLILISKFNTALQTSAGPIYPFMCLENICLILVLLQNNTRIFCFLSELMFYIPDITMTNDRLPLHLHSCFSETFN